MKISRKAKTGCAVVLAALMTLTGVSMKQTYAAGAVNENEPRSITVTASLGQNNSQQDQEYVEDLRSMNVPVALYQVATVDVTGQKFTPVAPFDEMKFDISDKTTAKEWQTMAAQAMKILAVENPKTNYNGPLQGGSDLGDAAVQVKFQNPDLGMYLVVAGREFNEDNTAKFSYNADYTKKYTFTPYLTALPSSPYTTTYDSEGNLVHTGTDGNTLSDGWDYNPEIGLKIATEPLYGKLEITKELDTYNETLGEVTFVYEIKDLPENGEAGTVFHEVVATNHKDLTEQKVVVDHIPAGITVRVEEIYRGASYDIVDPGMLVQNRKIWSDEAVREASGTILPGEREPIKANELTFRNKYNGGDRGGYGVTNEFTMGADGWTWTRPENVPPLDEE